MKTLRLIAQLVAILSLVLALLVAWAVQSCLAGIGEGS